VNHRTSAFHLGAAVSAKEPHAPTSQLVFQSSVRDQMISVQPATGVPRKSPLTLISSSAPGQWMPSPSPSSSQSARCSGVARRRRGNQASGVEIRRPSARTTVNSSSVTSTCRARGLGSTAKELMPSLQESLLVVCYEPHDFTQLMRGEAYRGRQCDGLKPELGQTAIALHMHMGRLAAFIAEEEEPIRADPLQCWHFASSDHRLIISALIIRLDSWRSMWMN
jgi:hypothetical protein